MNNMLVEIHFEYMGGSKRGSLSRVEQQISLRIGNINASRTHGGLGGVVLPRYVKYM